MGVIYIWILAQVQLDISKYYAQANMLGTRIKLHKLNTWSNIKALINICSYS